MVSGYRLIKKGYFFANLNHLNLRQVLSNNNSTNSFEHIIESKNGDVWVTYNGAKPGCYRISQTEKATNFKLPSKSKIYQSLEGQIWSFSEHGSSQVFDSQRFNFVKMNSTLKFPAANST